MTDIHNHLLYGIDDGSINKEQSIEILKELKEIGFNNIILTPHYIDDTKYTSDIENNNKILKELKLELNKQNIDINLYLGNEIYITENILTLLNSKKITTLNNTNYLLIELPLNNKLNNLEDYLHELIVKGYKIIIAHPERYIYFQDNKEELLKLKEKGILYQCNYYSIIKKYGRKAYKLIKYMLKNNLVDYLGTDIHRSINKKDFEKINKKLNKLITKEYIELINKNNNKLV